MVHDLEQICVLRIACKSEAQISEVKFSVIAHFKRPPGRFGSVTRCDNLFASTTTSSSPGLFPSRPTYSLPSILLKTILVIQIQLFKQFLLPPMSRYTSFHPPRDILPPSPCTGLVWSNITAISWKLHKALFSNFYVSTGDRNHRNIVVTTRSRVEHQILQRLGEESTKIG
jgi:hypothetical protein